MFGDVVVIVGVEDKSWSVGNIGWPAKLVDVELRRVSASCVKLVDVVGR